MEVEKVEQVVQSAGCGAGTSRGADCVAATGGCADRSHNPSCRAESMSVTTNVAAQTMMSNRRQVHFEVEEARTSFAGDSLADDRSTRRFDCKNSDVVKTAPAFRVAKEVPDYLNWRFDHFGRTARVNGFHLSRGPVDP